MNSKSPLKNLLADQEVMEEIRSAHGNMATRTEAATDGSESTLDVLLGGDESALSEGAYTQTEAIILLTGRPPLIIQDGVWQTPELASIRKRLDKSADALKKLIPKVGRVEVVDRSNYVGTGWMIDEGVMITNRHVAEVFAERSGNVFSFRRDPDQQVLQARVDFKREYQRSDTAFAQISEIIYLEEKGGVRPDMAMVRLAPNGGSLPEPVELDDANPEFDTDIAVIGYPAEDPRNDAFAMQDIFRGVYKVKRLSPGKVRGVDFDGKRLMHDCTTLGGNSGSVVFNLNTGKACGLHFSGDYRVNNYAVSVGWLKARLAEIGSNRLISIPSVAPAPDKRQPTEEVETLGYDPVFLGADFEIPLPEITAAVDIAPVTGSEEGELKYTHFSIVMNSRRRMPYFTACNIDGGKMFNFTRGNDQWFFDARIDEAFQIGEDLYGRNPLDRGHLVRRLDPAWGDSREEAKRGEEDTFYFTNCTPQHSRLNQRTWLSLEDYVLGNATTHDLKVTVFTGPVMAGTDREYRGALIPEEYWKVVVIVSSHTGQLSATGYLLSQADYLGDLEFVFGEFRTYQLPLAQVAEKTGLSFGDLTRYDPLNQAEGQPIRLISGNADIAL
ncbi:DNA/RNA non-specific endonuclease [Luteolibacter flavescens]|uniref:DNA/RNA non-specific endonuclease n=1 Tax=Luteolibacter flavescens TaxID=1859460 RepID=A0ABT3FUY0_9BACT|nr:DNA/RNA non-specific endonuclease [Luteolibacter flavescens]MCW1887014.1 DNA/RNA non-specific endonuclease [Luteolibacter flavescens]